MRRDVELHEVYEFAGRKDCIHVQTYNNGLKADDKLPSSYNRWPQDWMLVPNNQDQWLENAYQSRPVPPHFVLVEEHAAAQLDLDAFVAGHPDVMVMEYGE
jgi:hypothetical protein